MRANHVIQYRYPIIHHRGATTHRSGRRTAGARKIWHHCEASCRYVGACLSDLFNSRLFSAFFSALIPFSAFAPFLWRDLRCAFVDIIGPSAATGLAATVESGGTAVSGGGGGGGDSIMPGCSLRSPLLLAPFMLSLTAPWPLPRRLDRREPGGGQLVVELFAAADGCVFFTNCFSEDSKGGGRPSLKTSYPRTPKKRHAKKEESRTMICLSFAGDGSIALTSRTSRGARAAERPHTARGTQVFHTTDPECE